MSISTILLVPESGELEHGEEFHNSYRGAATIWRVLGKRYLGWAGHELFNETESAKLWALVSDNRLKDSEKAVLESTFDHAMLKIGDVPRFCDALDEFTADYELAEYHTELWSEYLRNLAARPNGTAAVCWIQTSVCADAWMVPDTDDADPDEDWRMYDLARDTGHFFLYEDKGESE